jgi:hypothetical protein
VARTSFFATGCKDEQNNYQPHRLSTLNADHLYQYFFQLIIGYVRQLRTVMFRYHQLPGDQLLHIPLDHKNAYCMSSTQRLNIQKSQHPLALEELEGRNIAYDGRV